MRTLNIIKTITIIKKINKNLPIIYIYLTFFYLLDAKYLRIYYGHFNSLLVLIYYLLFTIYLIRA